jgi:hypothetical protein
MSLEELKTFKRLNIDVKGEFKGSLVNKSLVALPLF